MQPTYDDDPFDNVPLVPVAVRHFHGRARQSDEAAAGENDRFTAAEEAPRCKSFITSFPLVAV